MHLYPLCGNALASIEMDTEIQLALQACMPLCRNMQDERFALLAGAF